MVSKILKSQEEVSSADFYVYEDFIYYRRKIAWSTLFEIIGWGTEHRVKYWLCANSWNRFWGDKGTFKIIKGENHLGIESNVCANNPNFSMPESYAK